jgi:hypothetical protein
MSHAKLQFANSKKRGAGAAINSLGSLRICQDEIFSWRFV